ncbi:hypothetical protein ABZ069_37305 [Streptomyces microflavus]|uniref:hypothetical protein n=1 Tax=Streptomyces microflavus TaxID=1919 RepID=UPI0033B7A04A
MTLQATYLAWDPLEHRPDCATPSWTVDIRTEHNAYRSVANGERHACRRPECGHTDRYDETSVRIVCISCGIVHIMSGESGGLRTRSTKAIGYGRPPVRAGGVWLYPGEPLLHGWGGEAAEPDGYLVTRTRVDRVTADNVIGAVHKERGPRRGVKWTGLAIPDANGRFGFNPVRWARAQDDLRSLTAAAKWVAAQGKDTDAVGASTTAPAASRP